MGQKEVKALRGAVDSKGPDMNKTLSAATLALVALLAGGGASAQTEGKPGDRNAETSRAALVSRLDAQFATLDTNRDGFLSDAERSAVRDARIEARFQRLDADKNGSISLAEMKAGPEHRGGPRAERGGKGGHHGRQHGTRGGRGGDHPGLNRDADKDGRISRAEFQGRALARFDRADADRNGVVTAAEHQAARGTMKGQRGR